MSGQLISSELFLDIVGIQVVKLRWLRGDLLTSLRRLSRLIQRLPTSHHRKRISSNRLTTFLSVLIHRVQIRRKRRRFRNTTREQVLITSIKRARRNRTVCIRTHRITRLDYLAGLLINPLNCILKPVDPLRRQTTSLGLNLSTRLRRILMRVILKHVKHGVIRVQHVTVLQHVRLIRTNNQATGPLALTVEHILITRQERVVVERGELTKTLSFFRREEQPIPVDVLRQVIPTTTSLILHPAAIVSSRSNLTKQAVRIVLGAIRENHLRAIITSQISVDQRTIVIATINRSIQHRPAAKRALKLQLVATLAINSGLGSLSNPLFLALFSNLALNPVLQRSLITIRPTTTTDLIKPKVNRSLRLNLIDRVIRQIRAVDLHTGSRNIRTVHLVHQARRKHTLLRPQVPEKITLDLASTTHHWVCISLIQVHDVVTNLLTECKTSIHHTVRTEIPAHTTRSVSRCCIRTHVTKVVAIELCEVIRIRVFHPHTNLLILRTIRVRIKLHNLALSVGKRLHLDGVVTIFTSHTGIHRRGNATLFRPLRIHTHTSHRNRLPRITRTRIHR